LHNDKRKSKEGERKGKKVVEAWIFTPEITMAV